ncbi:MAG: exosortase E/protease, VPEID-CTERM system, partial [Rhodovulum sp.]
MNTLAEVSTRPPRAALAIAAALLAAEVAAIGLIFKHAIAFECLANWPVRACSAASGTLVALYCLLGALALFAMLRPQPLRDLARQAGARLWPLGLNLAGTALALVPVAFLREGSGTAALIPSFGFWSLGMTLLLGGLMLYVAPVARWRAFVAETWTTLLPVLAAGALAPSLAILIRPLWRVDTIADATFTAVAWLIGMLGYDVETDPARKVIGTDAFAISVAPQCSGIEGIALVTVFVTLYLVLFRREMRFPRALLLYPLGIAASALFNLVRITLLLIIGLEGNPALAVGGFHSHAGWLMFTLVALGIVALAQTVPALKTAPDARATDPVPAGNDLAPLPFWRDPVVARILPFAVFMLSALAVSTLSQVPGMLYPARVLVLGAVVLVFLPIYARLSWA